MGNELYAFIFLLVLASHGNSAPEQAKKLNHAELPVATASESVPKERVGKDAAKTDSGKNPIVRNKDTARRGKKPATMSVALSQYHAEMP